jgi:PiT family inorganic phosphate transporter
MLSLPMLANTAFSNPLLAVSLLLLAGTIFVNGATDAANAIAEVVGTETMTFERAVKMAGVCNFLGLMVSAVISTAVATTIEGMVDFGGDSHAALVALCAAMVGIVAWGCVAWVFGIPTSESHALIAGLSGSAIAFQGGISGISWGAWQKVLWGLVLSTLGGFVLGFIATRILDKLDDPMDPARSERIFGKMQVAGAGFGALMHGAQDGQKFLATAMIIVQLATGLSTEPGEGYPFWLILACSLILAAGTAVGGRKIVETVGSEMVPMEKYQGAAASITAGFSLLASTLGGLPVSTTHAKSASILGAGAAKDAGSVNWRIAHDMLMTWLLTFPGCGLIGYLLTRVFLAVL